MFNSNVFKHLGLGLNEGAGADWVKWAGQVGDL